MISDLKEISLFEPLISSRFAVYFGDEINRRLESMITNVSVDFSRKRIFMNYANGHYRDDSILISELMITTLNRIIATPSRDYITLEYRRGDATPFAHHRFHGLKVKNTGCMDMDIRAETDTALGFIELKFKTCDYSIITTAAEIQKEKKTKKKGGKKK